MSDLKHEILPQVGADRGTISLVRACNADGTMRFSRETNESFHADLLSAEDQKRLNFHSHDDTEGVFSEALNLLKEYPWHQLFPLKIHPEFSKTIYAKVI